VSVGLKGLIGQIRVKFNTEAYLALDRRYITQGQFQGIYEQARPSKKLIKAFITYLRKSNQSKKLK
jgi:hypothetical protein